MSSVSSGLGAPTTVSKWRKPKYFGGSYGEMHEAEIMEDVVSESGLADQTRIIGERFGAV